MRIFRELVDSCILDVEIAEQKGKCCGEMACERWQGEARGRRELIRLGRVNFLFFSSSFVTRLILARLRDRFLDLGCRCRKMDSCGRR